MTKQQQIFDAASVGQQAPIDQGDLGKETPADIAAERVEPKDLDLATFMEELVTVRIEPSGIPGEVTPVVSVNGVNQPIMRGVPTVIKRKYLEASARSRVTTVQQRLADPANPSSIKQVLTSVPAYPFVVLEDKNPRGHAWLESIVAQS